MRKLILFCCFIFCMVLEHNAQYAPPLWYVPAGQARGGGQMFQLDQATLNRMEQFNVVKRPNNQPYGPQPQYPNGKQQYRPPRRRDMLIRFNSTGYNPIWNNTHSGIFGNISKHY